MQEQTNEYNPGQETEQDRQDSRQDNQNVVTETNTETGNTATEADVTTHRTQYEPAEGNTGTADNNDGA